MLRHASAAAVGVRRDVPLRPVLSTDELTDVLERRGVRYPAAEELRSMVVEHRLGSIVVRRLDLCQVLPDRHERDAVAPGRGGVRRQVAERGDVPCLVAQDAARGVEPSPGALGAVDGGAARLLHHTRTNWSETRRTV